MQVCWLHLRTPVTYLCKLPGILSFDVGGIVPFTRCTVVISTRYHVNGKRGSHRASPFQSPAAPREIGATHCAHLPPICLRSARLVITRPIHGTRPFGASASAVQNCSRQFCPARLASGRRPWRPDLVICASVHRFQRGTSPHRGKTGVSKNGLIAERAL
ncbi:hypothetical protein C0557_07645 [Kosakonia sp. MUSA4]|nr:hypothetical protein C0557_07645 [Kosakonia sp. MUSA4]